MTGQKKSGYEVSEEHIIIEGIPVLFLSSYNPLVSEAVEYADQVEIFGVKTFMIKPEYLMVIMLDTYRAKDRERLMKFLSQAKYSTTVFESLLSKFNLVEKYKDFAVKYYE